MVYMYGAHTLYLVSIYKEHISFVYIYICLMQLEDLKAMLIYTFIQSTVIDTL